MGGISWKEAQLLPSKMAYFKLLILLVPGILGQTQHFKRKKKDPLLVKQIDVYLVSAATKAKDIKNAPILERFECKNYNIGGTKLPQETKACQTGPYHYSQIEKAVFTMDTDGTNNDVKFKIEADANNVTCETELSSFADDWSKGDTEIWLRKDFGTCKDKLYKITEHPTFSISKTGKDDLKVKSSHFYMRRLDNEKTTKYDCGKFELKGDCNKLPCIKKFRSCTVSTVGAGAAAKTVGRKTTTKRPKTTTKATTTTVKPTTKGKGFLSNLASKLG